MQYLLPVSGEIEEIRILIHPSASPSLRRRAGVLRAAPVHRRYGNASGDFPGSSERALRIDLRLPLCTDVQRRKSRRNRPHSALGRRSRSVPSGMGDAAPRREDRATRHRSLLGQPCVSPQGCRRSFEKAAGQSTGVQSMMQPLYIAAANGVLSGVARSLCHECDSPCRRLQHARVGLPG
jgi:hypothetical protein